MRGAEISKGGKTGGDWKGERKDESTVGNNCGTGVEWPKQAVLCVCMCVWVCV